MTFLGKIWRAVYPVLLYLALQIFFIAAVSFISGILQVYDSLTGAEAINIDLENAVAQNAIIITGLLAFSAIPFMAGLYADDVSKWGFDDGIEVNKTNLKDYIMVILLGASLALTLNIALTFIFNVFKINDQVFEEVNKSISNTVIAAQFLVVVILGPIVEELIFRGLVYRRMRKYFSNIPAVIMSSFLFGLIHFNISQGVYAGLIGILLAYIYYKKENIFLCIGYHMGANATAILISSLIDGFENDIAKGIVIMLYALFAIIISIIGLVYVIKMRVNKNELAKEEIV